jgi:hypothetical protein
MCFYLSIFTLLALITELVSKELDLSLLIKAFVLFWIIALTTCTYSLDGLEHGAMDIKLLQGRVDLVLHLGVLHFQRLQVLTEFSLKMFELVSGSNT